MRKEIDKDFLERINAVKDRLPTKKYCILMNYEFPGKHKDTHIYSVMHRHVVDYNVLVDLERIAKRYEENAKKIKKTFA